MRTTDPIFVVGAPRTGTTLTMEILNRHSLVHLYNEVHYNERIADVVGNGGGLKSAVQLDKAISLLLDYTPWAAYPAGGLAAHESLRQMVESRGISHANVFATFLEEEARAHGKEVWGDSTPQDVLYLETLKSWYPGAKFVGLVRDPRAFLASYKNYYRKGIKSYRNRFNPLANSLLWRSYMRALLGAKASHLGPDIFLLRYEALVSNPEEQIRSMCSFLGLEFEPGMLDVGRQNSSYFSVKEDGKQRGISSSSRDRWQSEISDAEIWVLESLARQQLVRLGYEPVDPGLKVGYLPELAMMATLLPARMFNLLFRTRKPFTIQKLKKVMTARD